MSVSWINRLGIMLTFLAGFMVAPELIGLERLTRAERRIEKVLAKVVSSLKDEIQPEAVFGLLLSIVAFFVWQLISDLPVLAYFKIIKPALYIKILGSFLLGIVFMVCILVPVFYWLLSRMLSRLDGNDRLQGLIISWGIAFFIIGNLLQLIATFLPADGLVTLLPPAIKPAGAKF